MWDQLKFDFGGTSTTRLRSLVLKFEVYRKDPKHMMTEHLRMMSGMIRDLKAAGNVLTNEQQVQARQEATKSAALIAHGGQRKPNGFKHKDKGKAARQGGPSTNAPKVNKGANQHKRKRGAKKNISKMKCYNYNKLGHFAHTGATRHVAQDRAGFVDYRKIPAGTHVVYMGNGSYEEALGVGSYQLHLRTGRTLLLHDVLYVPGVLYNLLSVFTLLQLGYDFHLSWNGLDILLDDVIFGHGSSTWHARLGHIGKDRMARLAREGLLGPLAKVDLPICEPCLAGKACRKPFGKAVRATQPLELIHSDICGPMNVKARHGASYFLTFIDDYTRYGYVQLIAHRYEALDCFKRFVAEVENQHEKSLKALQTDRGREYLSDQFKDLCEEKGIRRQLTISNTPQQNGVAERRNRTLLDMFPPPHTNFGKAKSPIWSIYALGDLLVLYTAPAHKYGKLGPRARKHIFIRYSDSSKGYVMYGEHPNGGMTEIESRDIDFIETDFPSIGDANRDLDLYELEEDEGTLPSSSEGGGLVPHPVIAEDSSQGSTYRFNNLRVKIMANTPRPQMLEAMSTLYCALDPIEYNRVSGCDSAKEIWDKLEVTYEGTNQVKESKMNMLVHEYELFVMKKDENISEMSTRSLPKRWEAKMTAISEARDLKVLTLEELFGSLMTYELEMNSKVEEEEVKPKKNFALKSSHHDHDNSEEERDEEEEIALMTRNFKKFLKKKKGFGRRFPKKGENKGESSKTETPTCYKCKKQGHYKNECPQVNKEKMKYKKKALKVTWDDSDESDSDNNSSDNEVTNLCLLGYINESNISEDEHASFCPLAFNDDESATEDLCLMAHGDEVCLISKSTKISGFFDSGCSRHMTGDKNKFTSLTLKDGGNVKFGDNSKGKIIGIVERGVSTRSKLKNICNNMAFLSQIEPKNINEAIEDESWILAMQEELNQFERNKVWTLAPRPKDHSVIGTKWVFRNKKDEEGIIVRNKARLVAQGYNQEGRY
uniref:Integrase catalytic domain-containing protein n=1 Tax=Fagus sylvatica TaxID=28930 RepID=A0A2N9HPJ0_FAGSY